MFIPDELQRKWLLQGAVAALLFTLAFIIWGAIWSSLNIEDINISDHLYNGLVFATKVSMISLFFGVSACATALLGIGGKEKMDCRLLSFAITNFLIVCFLFWGGNVEMRNNEPPTLKEKVLDFLIEKSTE